MLPTFCMTYYLCFLFKNKSLLSDFFEKYFYHFEAVGTGSESFENKNKTPKFFSHFILNIIFFFSNSRIDLKTKNLPTFLLT